MNKISLICTLLMVLNPAVVKAAEEGGSAAGDGELSPGYLGIQVDRLVLDTSGLEASSMRLADSIEGLAEAIALLSADDANLNEEQKQQLLASMQNIDRAAVAFTQLAQQLPGKADQLKEGLPRAIAAAQQPLAELGRGLESARNSIEIITESLPVATENAKQLVNATLDAAVIRLSIYTAILVAALALALIGIMWFIYQQYLDPLTRKLDELVGAPEHFDNMSRYMRETAGDLLILEQSRRRVRQRSAARFRRDWP